MSEATVCPFCAGKIPGGQAECPLCGHSLENTNPHGALPLGTVLGGRYTLGEFRYADGEGIQYRAVDGETGAQVNIKEYLPVTLSSDRAADGTLHPKAGSEVLFKTTRMDFADLYRALRHITPAKGLETVLDVIETNNTVYAIAENPGGVPLARYLDTVGGILDPNAARSMLRPVFDGVAAMHAAGLVHRGVSPKNIRVLGDGSACLTGYATIGLRTAGSSLRPQLYEGFSAPEQYSSAEFEGRYTDEYGLSAVYYRMICGQAPVPAGQRLVADSNPRARKLKPGIPEYLSIVLEQALALKPSERFQTVPELMQALASPEAAKAALLERRKAASRTKGGTQRRITGLLAGVLILLAVLVCLGFWGALNRDKPAAPSSEPEPSPTATAEPAYMPSFVDKTYAQIQADDDYGGRFRFYITQEFSSEKGEGIILRQSPEPGALLGSDVVVVDLVVSKGPQLVAMPNIIGFTQDGAISELERLELKPACYMVANDGSYASGCVVRTSVEAGTELQQGSTVTVYIAAERDVEIEPTPSPSPTPDAAASDVPEELD